MARLCLRCGHELRADARFCDGCGEPVVRRSERQPTGEHALKNLRRPRGSARLNGDAKDKTALGARDASSPAGVGYHLDKPKADTASPATDLRPPRSRDFRDSSFPADRSGRLNSDREASIAEGEVRGMQTRTEQDEYSRERSWLVWSFRLNRHDDSGNPTAPVLVEMRARSFDGAVHDGDSVAVIKGEWRGSGLLATQLRNLTTNSLVSAKGDSVEGKRAGATLGIWVWALFSAAFLIGGFGQGLFPTLVGLMPLVLGIVYFALTRKARKEEQAETDT